MKTVEWVEGVVRLIDQTRLPGELVYRDCQTTEDVAEAIVTMKVRGAPAIGVTAGYGLALAAWLSPADDLATWLRDLDRAASLLKSTRPTAVNLFWALDRVRHAAAEARNVAEGRERVLQAAHKVCAEDRGANRRMGQFGAALIPDHANVLTHCNTGALATVDYGTALGVVRAAHAAGKSIHVWVDETRPALQGSRLTAWELLTEGIPHTVIVDGAAGLLMRQRRVDVVIVGADRIAANGDVANKVGTYSLAVLARAHDVPFYVAAPTSTIDSSIANGSAIPIEERNPDEIRLVRGALVAPGESPALNPAFDVTPQDLVAAIITEHGVARPPYRDTLEELINRDARSVSSRRSRLP